MAVEGTEPVIPLPSPRQMLKINKESLNDVSLRGPSFTVVTYNVLADVYATSEQFPNCPSFALNWEYRKQRLLKEILQCHPDIICLQEVQQNHFISFFHPELAKLGYEGVFKEKERQLRITTVDGCATFYKVNKFHFVTQWSIYLGYNDNIALQVILSFKNTYQSLCIANTHIHTNPRNNDIKVRQVYNLLKALEPYFWNQRHFTLILCGDFNSLPGSVVHSFLTTGKVDPSHEEISNFDPSERLHLRHTIPSKSAYHSYSLCNIPLQEVWKKIVLQGEPRFTKFVKNGVQEKFKGTIDYIIYNPKKLQVVSLLELIDEDEVKDRALPSVMRSSDHIPIAAEFRYIS